MRGDLGHCGWKVPTALVLKELRSIDEFGVVDHVLGQTTVAKLVVAEWLLSSEGVLAYSERVWVLDHQTVIGLLWRVAWVEFVLSLDTFCVCAQDRVPDLVLPVRECDLVVYDGVLDRPQL